MIEPQIHWILPWYGLSQVEAAAFHSRLAVEITEVHPLWGKIAQVVGRRRDQDDILVKLTNGKFASIHLVWSDNPRSYSAKSPWITIYESLDDFVASMKEDAAEYFNDDTKRDKN